MKIFQKKLETVKKAKKEDNFVFLKYLYMFLTAAAPKESILICKKSFI